jgi:hypothetical protein
MENANEALKLIAKAREIAVNIENSELVDLLTEAIDKLAV